MSIHHHMGLLPLFISFPRTGAHWLNCVMELYFNRPRLREARTTFLDRSRTDWMWLHDHDLKLRVRHPNVLFLYRNPVDTIFSNLVYDAKNTRWSLRTQLLGKPSPDDPDPAGLKRRCTAYRQHCEYYLLSPNKARTCVRHENFKVHRAEEFAKICAHFEQPLEIAKMERAFATVTPEALVARTGDTAEMGRHMLDDGYKARREAFAQKWGAFIEELVITPELRPFFTQDESAVLTG